MKKFDFKYKENLSIVEIKQILDTETFELNPLTKKNGEKTDDYWHWNNLDRFAVRVKKILIEEIKENKELSLHLEKEIRKGKQGEYTHFSIYRQKDIDRLYDDRVQDRSHFGEYRNDYLDAYENDESNFWNND